MLFRKDMEPRCAYCTKGNVICERKGIVAVEYHCARFRYDPFKRVPPRPVKLETSKLKAEDFSI